MPLFEYHCRDCGHLFEILVRGSEQPSCTTCQSRNLERLLSSFGVGSESRSHATLQAARREFTYSARRQDQLRHEHEQIQDHVREDYGINVPKVKD